MSAVPSLMPKPQALPLLGKYKNLHRTQKTKKEKSKRDMGLCYDLLRVQSRMIRSESLPKHASLACSRIPIPTKQVNKVNSVQIHSYPATEGHEGLRCGFTGLFRCASPMVCPVCSVVIRARRAQEVVFAGRRMLEEGFTFVFGTFTAHHTSKTDLPVFRKQFNAAKRHMKSGAGWQKFSHKWGLRHSIGTIEVTDDHPDTPTYQRSGWHFHGHTIFFLERQALSAEKVREFENELARLWLHALHREGLTASEAHGCKIEAPRTRAGAVKDSALRGLAAYVSKLAAWELTGQDTKEGRRERRISSWTLQKLALTKKPELLPRYAEYMAGVRGISFMQWSRGLKAFVGLTDIDDAELLHGHEGTLLYELTLADLHAVASQGGQFKLLRLAEERGVEGILAGLAAAYAGCDIVTGEFLGPESPYAPWQNDNRGQT